MIALDFGQSEKVDLTPIYNSLTYHQYEIDLLKSKPPFNVSFSLNVDESKVNDGYDFCNKGMYGSCKTDTMVPFPDFGKPMVWNHHGLAVYISQLYQAYYYDIFEFCGGAVEANAMNMGVNNYFLIKLAEDVSSSFQANQFTFITYPSMKRKNEAFLKGCEVFTHAYAFPHGTYSSSYTVSNTYTIDGRLYSTTHSFCMKGHSDFASNVLPEYTRCSYYYFTTSTHFTPGMPNVNV